MKSITTKEIRETDESYQNLDLTLIKSNNSKEKRTIITEDK